jgi:hypothetical protein
MTFTLDESIESVSSNIVLKYQDPGSELELFYAWKSDFIDEIFVT